MNESGDTIVEENIPETLSPNHNMSSVLSPRNSPTINKSSVIEELVDHVDDENIVMEESKLKHGGINELQEEESIVAAVSHEIRIMKSITTPPRPSKKKLVKSNSSSENKNVIVGEKTEEKQLSPHSLSVQELIRTTQNLIGNLDIQLPKEFSNSSSNKSNKSNNNVKQRKQIKHNNYGNNMIMLKPQVPSTSTFKTSASATNISKRDLRMQRQLDTTAAVSAARNIMAERARDRMLKKEHDKLVARLLKEKEMKAQEEERKRRSENKRQVIEREKSERMQNVKRWQIERDAAAKAKLEKEEQLKQRKIEQKLKLKEARKKRMKKKKLENTSQQYNNLQHTPLNNNNTITETTSTITLGSEPGSDNYALDSMISQYISISSGLRAQLHITELRLASRARVAKRGREIDAESLGTKISSPSKTEKAYDIVSRVRKLLSTVDEELPTLHHLLSDVEFLAKPKLTRSAIKDQHGCSAGGKGESSYLTSTPPIIRKSQEVLRSVINFEAKSPEMRSSRSMYNSNNVSRNTGAKNASPGQASSAFLDFNEITSRSKQALLFNENDDDGSTDRSDDTDHNNNGSSDWEVNAVRNHINKRVHGEQNLSKRSPNGTRVKSSGSKSRSRSKKRDEGRIKSQKSKSARSATSSSTSALSRMPKISRNLSVAEIRAIKQKKIANGGIKLAFQATKTAKRKNGRFNGLDNNNNDIKPEDEIRNLKKVKKKKKVRTKKKIKKVQALSIVKNDDTHAKRNVESLIENKNRFDDYNCNGSSNDGMENSKSTSDLSTVYANHPGITFIP
jgi:hypothetical protein